jgi:phosphoglycerate dehydrogenase-like enzyme
VTVAGLAAPSVSADWNSLRAASGTLRGETVLLVGFGAIARRLAELLRPFGVNVVAFRRQPRGDEDMPVVTEGGLAEALSPADHGVNIPPESDSTRRVFAEERFGQVRRGATFRHLGRGATVDQTALVTALNSDPVGAAWLDVTDPEPRPDDHPPRRAPNCYTTPHVAGGHAGKAVHLVRHFLANLDRCVRGKPLPDRVF